MRKNLLYRILLIAVPIAMLFSSCTKKDDMSIDKTQKVDLVFQANLTKPMLKAANENLPYDIILSKLDCDFEELGTIRVKIVPAEDLPGGELPEGIETVDDIPGTQYDLSYTEVGDGVASDLMQLIPGDYYLTMFQVGNGTGEDFYPYLAVPMFGSSFNDFVTKTLPEPFTVGDYDKTRVVLDVLCFNQQLAPAFGFEWFDYNIVKGDEICVFVNCINEYDREKYHQVFAANMYAWKAIMEGENYVYSGDDPYWEVGPNYELVETAVGDGSEVVGSVKPMCFPLWDILADLDAGLFLELDPVFGKTAGGKLIFEDSVMVHISRDIILDYIMPIEDYQGLEETDLVTGIKVKVEKADVGEDYTENPRYIHITLPDCNKPAYFESHNDNNGAHEIYALRFDYPTPGEVDMTKILDLTETDPTMRDPHIAVAPNRRQLYVVDSDNSDKILVYDLYSMTSDEFTVHSEEPVPEKITQLVFMHDTLFAADMNNELLTIYALNPDNTNWETYKQFDLTGEVDFEGGDLIAVKNSDGISKLWSFSKNGSTAYVHEIDIATGAVTSLADETGMTNIFGVMVYGDNTIITGSGGASGLANWSWDGSAFSPLGTFAPNPVFTYVYGDLASPFILDLTE